MDNQLTILKRDDLGRVQSTAESRAAAVAEYQRSGLSATAFAKMAGIAPTTFWNWLHAQGLTQKRPRALAGASKPVRFVQVTPQPVMPATMSLQVRLPGGVVIEVADSAQAVLTARLIEALNLPAAP
jgi:transposase-like protein